MWRHRFAVWSFILLSGPFLVLISGCKDGSPKVFPVNGRVAFKGKPGNMRQLVGCKVRWQSTSDPSTVAVGVIEDDGVFSLGAMLKEKALSGVPAGQYKARLEPRPADEADIRPTAPFHPKYLDYDKSGLTFTVPVTGEILIEVEGR